MTERAFLLTETVNGMRGKTQGENKQKVAIVWSVLTQFCFSFKSWRMVFPFSETAG